MKESCYVYALIKHAQSLINRFIETKKEHHWMYNLQWLNRENMLTWSQKIISISKSPYQQTTVGKQNG